MMAENIEKSKFSWKVITLGRFQALSRWGVLAGANFIALRRASFNFTWLVDRYACRVIPSPGWLGQFVAPIVFGESMCSSPTCSKAVNSAIGFILYFFVCSNGLNSNNISQCLCCATSEWNQFVERCCCVCFCVCVYFNGLRFVVLLRCACALFCVLCFVVARRFSFQHVRVFWVCFNGCFKSPLAFHCVAGFGCVIFVFSHGWNCVGCYFDPFRWRMAVVLFLYAIVFLL